MDKGKIRSVPHFAHQDKQDGCKKRKHTGPREKKYMNRFTTWEKEMSFCNPKSRSNGFC